MRLFLHAFFFTLGIPFMILGAIWALACGAFRAGYDASERFIDWL
jgi:hypothetical protein